MLQSRIYQSFNNQAKRYHSDSPIQRQIAQRLTHYFPKENIHKILEIGCGTGHLSQHLCNMYPDAHIDITDISPNMVEACQLNVKNAKTNHHFKTLSAEQVEPIAAYDLIVSSMALQWLTKPINTLERLVNALTSRGVLLYACPGMNHFKQWNESATLLNLSTGLHTPIDWPGILKEETITTHYQDAYHFIHSLKAMGASTPKLGYHPMSYKDFNQLCRQYNAQYQGEMDWHVLYGKLTSG